MDTSAISRHFVTRQIYDDCGPFALRRSDLEGAIQLTDTFLNAHEAQPCGGFAGHSNTVVANDKTQCAYMLGELDFDGVCLRMPCTVGQRLLNNSIKVCDVA